MKHTKLILLLVFQVCIAPLKAAQESKEELECQRQQAIAQVVQNYSGLYDGFEFLQSQGLIEQSFEGYLQQYMPEIQEDEEFDLDMIVGKAEDIIALYLKEPFLSMLTIAMKEQRTLDSFGNEPLFAYVMKHKNDYMHDITSLWLYEWSKTEDTEDVTPMIVAAVHNSCEVATLLIAAKSNVNIKNNYGYTPLHGAAEKDNKQVAEILITAGADVNSKDKDSYGVLHAAADNNSKEVLNVFIAAHADINIQDGNGWAPLHWAANNNYKEIAELLIEADADLNIQNHDGEIAEQLAQTDRMRLVFQQARQKHQEQLAGATF